MQYNQYKFKFYLNANHMIYLDGVSGQNHPHTWEIAINTLKIVDGFIQFNDVEKAVDGLLSAYQDVSLNDVEPFNFTNPTVENLCEFFKNEIRILLRKNGWVLLTIEVSETPTRSYIIDISDEIDDEILAISPEKSKAIETIAEEKLSEILKENGKN
ncbi:MAG: 6-carboxytetrahydropterin synthase [Oscillospiraceae bacterium]